MEIKRLPVDARNVIRGDIPTLQSMCGTFLPREDWLKDQVTNASDILYALDGKNILGYLIANKQNTHLEIELICVGREGRALTGVGRALMAVAEEIAKEYGLTQIQLDSQFSAEGFYEKLNYKVNSRNNSGIRMKKVL